MEHRTQKTLEHKNNKTSCSLQGPGCSFMSNTGSLICKNLLCRWTQDVATINAVSSFVFRGIGFLYYFSSRTMVSSETALKNVALPNLVGTQMVYIAQCDTG